MQLYELKPIHKLKKRKRIGRGGKRGTYSGRGIKGQKARAGRRLKPIIRELIKKYPKLRGYRFKKVKEKPVILNIEILEKKFKSSEIINPKVLLERRLIRRIKGKMPKVKILGRKAPGRHPPTTPLTKKLIIEGCQVSKSAREEIEKAGGIIK